MTPIKIYMCALRTNLNAIFCLENRKSSKYDYPIEIHRKMIIIKISHQKMILSV